MPLSRLSASDLFDGASYNFEFMMHPSFMTSSTDYTAIDSCGKSSRGSSSSGTSGGDNGSADAALVGSSDVGGIVRLLQLRTTKEYAAAVLAEWEALPLQTRLSCVAYSQDLYRAKKKKRKKKSNNSNKNEEEEEAKGNVGVDGHSTALDPHTELAEEQAMLAYSLQDSDPVRELHLLRNICNLNDPKYLRIVTLIKKKRKERDIHDDDHNGTNHGGAAAATALRIQKAVAMELSSQSTPLPLRDPLISKCLSSAAVLKVNEDIATRCASLRTFAAGAEEVDMAAALEMHRVGRYYD